MNIIINAQQALVLTKENNKINTAIEAVYKCIFDTIDDPGNNETACYIKIPADFFRSDLFEKIYKSLYDNGYTIKVWKHSYHDEQTGRLFKYIDHDLFDITKWDNIEYYNLCIDWSIPNNPDRMNSLEEVRVNFDHIYNN